MPLCVIKTGKCTHCPPQPSLPHSPPNGSEFKKRGGLSFIYRELRMAQFWLSWEPEYGQNFWQCTAVTVRFRLDLQTQQKKDTSVLRTWNRSYRERMKNLSLPLFALCFWISSLPGDFCRAAHIGDLSQQHCELCMLESWVLHTCLLKLVLWECAGIKMWRRVWVFMHLSFVFFSQGSHGHLTAVAPASVGTSRSLGTGPWRSPWRRQDSHQEEEQTITI